MPENPTKPPPGALPPAPKGGYAALRGSTKEEVARRRALGKGVGGRPKGVKNKATREREKKLAEAARAAEILEKARVSGTLDPVEAAMQSGRKLMKDLAFDYAHTFAGLAELHKPFPTWIEKDGKLVNANPHYDAVKFKEYALLASDVAIRAAPFESPRFSAMLIGATTINKVEVTGGMPDDFAAPASIPAAALPAGTIIEAEEDYVSPVAAA